MIPAELPTPTLDLQPKYPQLDQPDSGARVQRKQPVTVGALYGGGDRGIITCRVHAQIEKITGFRMGELIKVWAGTSTGGIIATAANVPDSQNPFKPAFSAEQLQELFFKKSVQIFPQISWYKKPIELIRPDYNAQGLHSVLEPFVKDLRFSECINHMIIPAAELTTGKPWWFTKTKVITDPRYTVVPPDEVKKIYTIDVVEATTAAPTYFPNKDIKLLGKTYQFMDGGTFANNPSRRAVTYAQSLFGYNAPMLVGCFGTGEPPTSYPGNKTQNAGLVYWGENFANATLSLTSDDVENEMHEMFPAKDEDQNLFIYQPKITAADDSLDDSSEAHLKRLLEDADRMLEDKHDEFRLYCKKLEAAHQLDGETHAQPPIF